MRAFIRFWLAASFAVLLALPATAADLRVMTSGAFLAPLGDLAKQYEHDYGVHIVIINGPSMGATPGAIPARLARGEAADAVILARSALDNLVKAGHIAPGSETDLVRSPIALAVKAGAPVPDISTVAALKATLINAKSIAYSDSASGVYVGTELFERLGIAEVARAKDKMIAATPVGEIVAKGEADVGFQQMSELLPVKGIIVVGPLPADVQKITVFSAGLIKTNADTDDAAEFVAFLASPSAWKTMRVYGLVPAREK